MRRLFSLRNSLLLSASFSAITFNYTSSQVQTSSAAKYYFEYGSRMIPHPEKAYKGGEDACYTNDQMLLVADGVGGWAAVQLQINNFNQHGVDPGLYSKELVKRMSEGFNQNKDKYTFNPKQLIIDSKYQTKAIGSTTVCLLTLEQLLIRTSFVGDSGYAIYRQDKKTKEFKLIFKSQEQQRGFNFPYQIGSQGDDPTCAIEDKHEMEVNDLIVVGTDGLFDNLSGLQIKDILNENYSEKKICCEEIADFIAKQAYKFSLDINYTSPFALQAKRYGYRFTGGKSDDITVVVAQIKKSK